MKVGISTTKKDFTFYLFYLEKPDVIVPKWEGRNVHAHLFKGKVVGMPHLFLVVG